MLFDFPGCLRDTAALNAGNLSKTRKLHLGWELSADTHAPCSTGTSRALVGLHFPEPAATHLVMLVAVVFGIAHDLFGPIKQLFLIVFET